MIPETPLSDEELEAIRVRLEKAIRAPVKTRRIKALKVNSSLRWQPPLHIRVGHRCAHLEQDRPPEKVLAILEAPSFMVITHERGYTNNLPYFFAREDVREVVLDD